MEFSEGWGGGWRERRARGERNRCHAAPASWWRCARSGGVTYVLRHDQHGNGGASVRACPFLPPQHSLLSCRGRRPSPPPGGAWLLELPKLVLCPALFQLVRSRSHTRRASLNFKLHRCQSTSLYHCAHVTTTVHIPICCAGSSAIIYRAPEKTRSSSWPASVVSRHSRTPGIVSYRHRISSCMRDWMHPAGAMMHVRRIQIAYVYVCRNSKDHDR